MKVALIGLGMVADMQAMALRATGGKVSLAGVYARDPEKTADFAARQPGHHPRPYASVGEIAADPDIDFAIVATPPDARKDIIRCLADAGKGILTEKPIERNFRDAAAIVAYCAAAGITLGVILQHRMRPAARHLKGLIATGGLGRIATVEVSVPWWRGQEYYEVAGRGTYRRDGGGVLITQGIHTLDLMLHLCGPVTRVQAMTATSALHDLEAEDFATAGLAFASGAIGSVMASTTSFPGRGEQIVINGTLGSAVLNAAALTVYWRSGKIDDIGEATDTGGGADPMAFTHAWHQSIIEDFADALRGQRPAFVTGQDALAVHALIDAMQLSSARGRVVDIKKDITND